MPGCGVKPGDQDGEVQVLLAELRNAADPVHIGHGELGFKAERFRKREEKSDTEEYEDSYKGAVSSGHAAGAPAGGTVESR